MISMVNKNLFSLWSTFQIFNFSAIEKHFERRVWWNSNGVLYKRATQSWKCLIQTLLQRFQKKNVSSLGTEFSVLPLILDPTMHRISYFYYLALQPYRRLHQSLPPIAIPNHQGCGVLTQVVNPPQPWPAQGPGVPTQRVLPTVTPWLNHTGDQGLASRPGSILIAATNGKFH